MHKELIVPRAETGDLLAPTEIVAHAHAAGLQVHAWTFRAENAFLPPALRSSSDPAATGDAIGEYEAFLRLGVDGLFTDQPELAVAARRDVIARRAAG